MINFHSYVHLLQAVGEGHIVQRRNGEFWENTDPSVILRDIASGVSADHFRCKPRAMTMGTPTGIDGALPAGYGALINTVEELRDKGLVNDDMGERANTLETVARWIVGLASFQASRGTVPGDPFPGDNAKLIGCIQAALDLDFEGCLQEPLGSFGRELLLSASIRLSAAALASARAASEAVGYQIRSRPIGQSSWLAWKPCSQTVYEEALKQGPQNGWMEEGYSYQVRPVYAFADGIQPTETISPVTPAAAVQPSLDEQIKNAQAEVASWSPEKRASMRLQGFDPRQGEYS